MNSLLRAITCGLIAAVLLSSCSHSVVPEEAPALAIPDSRPADSDSLPAARADVLEDRFARLAYDCVHREYPNKISHVLNDATDARTPRELTPAFYGCYDWHSSVHGHWLLTRVLKRTDSGALQEALRQKLRQSFTTDHLAAELDYYQQPGRASFERPYGLAWYLQLVAELHESDDPELRRWREVLRPLEQAIVAQISQWLPKLAYPIRLGTHNQSAFAFGLMIDYARTTGLTEFEQALVDKSLHFHLADKNCPLHYEPSGEDFLSPCLMVADLMRRVLPQPEFSRWLTAFLPSIPSDGSTHWLAPGVVRDPADGKLVHLDGVNLSRAWALMGISASLPSSDPRQGSLRQTADLHRQTGLSAVSDQHYAGSHWLASFALYLTSQRGID